MTDDPVMKDYTVTISGQERDAGEQPFTYVVRASDFHTASEYALHHHVVGAPAWRLLGLRIEEVSVGAPEEDCGFYWNDLRPKKEVTNES